MSDIPFETNLGLLQSVILLLVNIAHFSYINETYGFDLYNNALIQSCFADKTIFVRDSRNHCIRIQFHDYVLG